MQTFFSWAVILAVGATVVVLAVGVLAMLRQGRFNERHSNTLMRFRILFQFTAIALIAIAFLLGRS